MILVSTKKLLIVLIIHRCQHQRTKKWDIADEKEGVRIFTARGRNWYCSTLHALSQQAKHTQFYKVNKQIHGTIKWWSCITKCTVSESLMSLCWAREAGYRVVRLPLDAAWSAFFPTRNTQKKSSSLRPKVVMLTPIIINNLDRYWIWPQHNYHSSEIYPMNSLVLSCLIRQTDILSWPNVQVNSKQVENCAT